MFDSQPNSFGKQFKKIRKERGYSAENVADGILSLSALYKFEENNMNLSFIKMIQLLQKIHIDLEDFVRMIDSNFNNQYQVFLNKINIFYSQNDFKGIENFFLSDLENYRTKRDNFDLVRASTAMALIKNLNHHYKINEPLVKDLTDFLFAIDEWNNFEITIFGNCLTIISSSVIYAIAEELIARSKQPVSNPKNVEYLLLALVNVIDIMIDRRDFVYAKKLIDNIETIRIPETSLLARFKLIFLKNILYLDSEEAKKVNGTLLTSLNYLGSRQLADAYQTYMYEFYHA
ncbi:helix-turn-helix domain-containing protein [Oenococcus sicerae]|uniref:Rgg/GadR/MutR family transcriptional regulator n=1 Tax=Oenococcus sicerae TaxID=2203724 RepID=A0AAJ1RAT7_9LACO|nr:Rgg/GadR/MutR family transcriptional regulator [Oenococcus sicerae]MDN6900178.1 Rgg/GadR/MutR family transcriptional regulator [Oenococcus sicerae]